MRCIGRKLSLFLFPILILLFGATAWLLLNLLERTKPFSSRKDGEPDTKLPQVPISSTNQAVPFILIYNDLVGSADWNCAWKKVGESNVVRTTMNCPTECHYAFDRYFQRFADMVLVSASGYDTFVGKKPNFNFTKANQLWTAYHFEPPPHSWGQGYTMVDDHFHWVANYRHDADIYLPFGRFYPRAEPEANVPLHDARSSLSKKKLASWLVSNCGIFEDAKARQILVETLQRFIPVDVFGKCSGRQCPPTGDLQCQVFLGQNYKFFLAFENSLCVDYVSEKFFMPFVYGMVPVVFGWADYSLYAPPGSYINALDYDSVEHLAEYLLYLDQHDDEYLKYFSWRGTFTVDLLFFLEKQLCVICQKMYDHLRRKRSANLVQQTKYPSYRKWHESFPVGSAQSPTFHIAERNLFNATKACIKYDEHPELLRWLRGE